MKALKIANKRFSIESIAVSTLAFLLFVIPLFEAPKNLLSLLVLIFAVVLFIKKKPKVDKTYLLLAFLLLTTSLISTINANVSYGLTASGFWDVFRYIALGISALLIAGYVSDNKTIIMPILVGSVLSLGFAAHELFSGTIEALSLKSVGHVNHSAIYLLITYCIGLPFLIFGSLGRVDRYIGIVSILAITVGIFACQSRAVIGGFIIINAIVFWLSFRNKRYNFIRVSLITVIAGGFLMSSIILSAIDKHLSWSDRYLNNQSYSETPRGQLNKLSEFVFSEYPLLGIGISNYSSYTKNELPELISERGIDLGVDAKIYGLHPHNLYYDQLTSIGIAGFLIFMLFWGYHVRFIWYNRTLLVGSSKGGNVDWRVVSMLLVIISHAFVGIFNTTLHHEVALLTFVTISYLYHSVTSSQQGEVVTNAS